MQQNSQAQGIFQVISPVVLALAIVIFAIEVVLQIGEAGLVGALSARSTLVFRFGVHPEIFKMMFAQGQFDPAVLIRLMSYLFVQNSLTDAVFNVVLLLSLGKFVGEILSPSRVLLVFLLSGIAAALGYVTLVGLNAWLISAHAGVYGLLGAYTFFLKILLQASGQQSRKAFELILALMGLQLFFQVIFGGAHTWVAMFCGFGAGFILAPLVLPGGLKRLLWRLRRDR